MNLCNVLAMFYGQAINNELIHQVAFYCASEYF